MVASVNAARSPVRAPNIRRPRSSVTPTPAMALIAEGSVAVSSVTWCPGSESAAMTHMNSGDFCIWTSPSTRGKSQSPVSSMVRALSAYRASSSRDVMRVPIPGRNNTAATRRGARLRSDPRSMISVNLHRGEGVSEFPRAAGSPAVTGQPRSAPAMSRRPEPRFDWFIPIDGDGAHIGTRRAERPPTVEYLRRVGETAEAEGYYALLIPTRFANGLFEETAPLAETWTTVTALAAVTRRIRFLVAVRPGFISTGLFAQMAAALDQISGGAVARQLRPRCVHPHGPLRPDGRGSRSDQRRAARPQRGARRDPGRLRAARRHDGPRQAGRAGPGNHRRAAGPVVGSGAGT